MAELSRRFIRCWVTLGSVLVAWSGAVADDPLVSSPFAIRVVDAESGRPVPLVELRTVHGVKLFTDNAGLAAFAEPGFAKRKVYFHVSSPGYAMAEDGFGFRGKRIPVSPGETVELELKREQLAERMFRITGAGRFHHSARLGLPRPDWASALNTNALGQDSAHTAVYGGKLFWIWGDTKRSEYPLGIFDVTAATSPMPASDPAKGGIALTYFSNAKGDTRAVAKMPGDGPTWLGGLVALKDKKGNDHLVASYVKVRGFLDVYRRGLCEWDDKDEAFKLLREFPDDTLGSAVFPNGHPVWHRVEDADYVYFGSRFPTMRVKDSYEAWRNPDNYEAVKSDVKLVDVRSGEPITPHHVSMAWNAFRDCYVALFARDPKPGEPLAETWYAEAPAPEGPWRKAVQVATHGAHSFYNPLQHPEFAQEGGRIIYFEGTYTTLFAKGAVPTPRYDYNQILYRLDLEKVAEVLDGVK